MSEQTLLSCCWHSRPENVQRARQTARRVIEPYAADHTDLLELAVGEACANAVEHGSPTDRESHFVLRCHFMVDVSALVFEVEDEGQLSVINAMAMPCVPEMLAEGRRGLFLIHQIMDDVSLKRNSHGLVLRMLKRIELSPLLFAQLMQQPIHVD